MFQSALRYLRKSFASDGSPKSSGDRLLSYMIGSDNLTALAAFCNTLFYYFEVKKKGKQPRQPRRVYFSFELVRR